MSVFEVVLIGLGLSMDAVAVSMSNGMVYRSMNKAEFFGSPVFFGAFQGIMPLLGYYLGSLFASVINKYAGVVTLLILGAIGGKMIYDGIKEGREKKDETPVSGTLSLSMLLLQAVATSIDAFAVGVGFSVSGVEIWSSVLIIAATTFLCSLIALIVGRKFGDILGNKAQIAGGAVLVIIGIKSFLTSIF